MHKIAGKEFTIDDFSHEHLDDDETACEIEHADPFEYDYLTSRDILGVTIRALNHWRERYLVALKTESETGLSAKDIWWQMIQLLPSSYNQRRTVMMNYEVLANIYKSRKDHKLDEWSLSTCGKYPVHPSFCDWIETLPYNEFITGEFE